MTLSQALISVPVPAAGTVSYCHAASICNDAGNAVHQYGCHGDHHIHHPCHLHWPLYLDDGNKHLRCTAGLQWACQYQLAICWKVMFSQLPVFQLISTLAMGQTSSKLMCVQYVSFFRIDIISIRYHDSTKFDFKSNKAKISMWCL